MKIVLLISEFVGSTMRLGCARLNAILKTLLSPFWIYSGILQISRFLLLLLLFVVIVAKIVHDFRVQINSKNSSVNKWVIMALQHVPRNKTMIEFIVIYSILRTTTFHLDVTKATSDDTSLHRNSQKKLTKQKKTKTQTQIWEVRGQIERRTSKRKFEIY